MRPSRLAAAVACVALSGCGAVGGAEPNPASAGWLAPAGTWLSEVSGKMNVPKPSAKFYTGHPLFLWPGLFISPGPHEGYPSRKAMGLFQPVLTLGQGCSSSIGCGPDKPWTIANWYSNCTGSTPDKANYCHDAYQSIQTGDTLSWYMRRVGSSSVFPMQYEMGWSSTLNTSQSAGPFVQTITAGGDRGRAVVRDQQRHDRPELRHAATVAVPDLGRGRQRPGGQGAESRVEVRAWRPARDHARLRMDWTERRVRLLDGLRLGIRSVAQVGRIRVRCRGRAEAGQGR